MKTRTRDNLLAVFMLLVLVAIAATVHYTQHPTPGDNNFVMKPPENGEKLGKLERYK